MVKYISSCAVLALLVSGCGSTNQQSINQSTTTEKDIKDIKKTYKNCKLSEQELQSDSYIYVKAKGNWSALSMQHGNNYIRAAIQKAAEETIALDKKYFAIVKPDKISNMNGININTIEAFNENCLSKNPFGGSDPCDVVDDGILSNNDSKLLIKVFDDKPEELSVYDAKVVLDTIKSNGNYQENISY